MQKFFRVLKIISGTATFLDGAYAKHRNQTHRTRSSKKNLKRRKIKITPKVVPVSYPNGAYGFTKLPEAETILFKNATVWTNESEGILQNTDVLVQNGRISKIGITSKAQKPRS